MLRLSFLPRHRLYFFLFFLFIIVLTIIISVIVTVVRFNDEGNTIFHVFLFNASQSTLSLDDTSKTGTTSFSSSALFTPHSASQTKSIMVLDKFLIECDFYSVDAPGSLLKGRVHITVPPPYRIIKTSNDTANLNVPSSSIPNMDIASVIGTRDRVWNNGRLIEDFDITVTMNGDLSDYPFDTYSCIAYFSMYNATSYFIDRTGKLPIGIAITGALQGFRIDSTTAQFTQFDGVNEIGFMFDITRSPLTIAFSSFIITLMWLISIVVFVISLDVILGAAASTRIPVPKSFIHDHPHLTPDQAAERFYTQVKMYRKARVVSAPLLALPLVLIFALPALRFVQPGVPTVGAYSDVVGFFWNVGLVAMSAVGISTVWLVRKDA